jgi:hypothetical protein
MCVHMEENGKEIHTAAAAAVECLIIIFPSSSSSFIFFGREKKNSLPSSAYMFYVSCVYLFLKDTLPS